MFPILFSVGSVLNATMPTLFTGNPKQNAKIVGKRMVSISSIPANEEILVSYGLGYKFPLETDRTILRMN